LPDDVPDFIADIISAARDEARHIVDREQAAEDGSDKPVAA